MSDEKEYGENVTKTNYQASKKGVVALGVYLVLMIVFSCGMLVILMTAETNPAIIEAAEKSKACAACNSNANTGNSNVNVAVNNTSEVSISPTPTVLANQTAANTKPNTNANVKTNTNVAVNSASNSNTKTSPTPAAAPLEQDVPKFDVPPKVKVWLFDSPITADGFLILIVMFAGMLGAIIRGIFSFTKHLGCGDFSFKWTWFYLLLPFSGAALSVILYLVIRGGFYSSAYGKGLVLNIFSFAALAALTGLFTENAMEKLRQVATTVLADTTPKTPNATDINKTKQKEKDDA